MKKLFPVFVLCALAALLVTACPEADEGPDLSHNDDVRGDWQNSEYSITLKPNNSWTLHKLTDPSKVITAGGDLFIFDGKKKLSLTIDRARIGSIDPIQGELYLSSVYLEDDPPTVEIKARDNPQLDIDVGESDLLSSIMTGTWTRQ